MLARLLLDDGPWSASFALPNDLDASLDSLCDALDDARDADEPVAKTDYLYELGIVRLDGVQAPLRLDALLYGEQQRLLQRDTRNRLMKLLDRCPTHTPAPSLTFDVQVDGRAVFSPAIDVVRARCADGEHSGCLTAEASGRRGVRNVAVAGGNASSVLFATSVRDAAPLYRAVIRDLRPDDEAQFVALAPRAYPGLAFVEGVFDGLRDFDCKFAAIRAEIMRHFAVLSDDGARIFAIPDRARWAAEFYSLGVNISSENGDTLHDPRYARPRQRVFAGELLTFNWHTKLHPNRNRIHVHPPTAGSNGRVIIGVMHEHLPLPGY